VGYFGHDPYQFSGDGGPATGAVLSNPQGVVLDGAGDRFIADAGDNVIREVYASGYVTTVVGTGRAGYAGDGGPAIAAALNGPAAVALDSSGDLFIADSGNNVIREVKPGPNGLLSLGTISTIAGGGSNTDLAFSGLATGAGLGGPYGLATDSSGNLYIADTGSNSVREVSGGNISTIAGNGTAGYSGDGSQAVGAELDQPTALAVDTSGHLYIADTGNNVVREVSSGNITTVPVSAGLNGPTGLAVDSAGNLYIADTGNNIVRELANGVITTFAGNETAGYAGDGQAATSAELNAPSGLAVSGNTLYIADSGNNVIRKVAGGNITTIAGNAAASPVAPWRYATGLAVDCHGDLFVADATQNTNYNAVYEVSPAGSITTVASNLNHPTGLAVNAQGDLFIADAGNDVVRELTPGADGLLSDGTMTILAGNGSRGYSGDNGPADAAQLNLDDYYHATSSLAVDAQGDLLIADSGNDAVREVVVS
jgi:sugar lactone lactonase YvrE